MIQAFQYLLKHSDRTRLVLLSFFSLLFLFTFAWPLANLGTFHLRVIEAFNSDEGEFLWPVFQAFERGDFNIGRYDYGLFYYNLGLFVCHILDWFTQVDIPTMAVVFRMESFLFLLASSWLFYDYGKRYFHPWVAVGLFLTSLLSSFTLLRYGVMVHPDIAQLFLIVLALYGLARFRDDKKLRWALVSIFGAGLAFSTKYAGIAFMPLIWALLWNYQTTVFQSKWLGQWKSVFLGLSCFWALVLDVSWISTYITQDVEATQSLYHLIYLGRGVAVLFALLALSNIFSNRISGLQQLALLGKSSYLFLASSSLFMLAFVVGSPQSIYRFNFLNGFLYVTNLHKDGHWFRDDSGLLGWLQLMGESSTLGWLWIAFSLVGMLVSLLYWRPKKWDEARMLPLYWIITFLVVIVFRVKSKFAHYLIPIIPFVIFYGILIMHFIVESVLRSSKIARNAIYGLFLLLFAIVRFGSVYDYKAAQIENYQQSDAMEAGYWMEENLQEDVMVLADKYTYIPAKANIRHRTVWGIHPLNIQEFDPDLLVIQHEVYRKFLDPNGVEDYLYGKENYRLRNELYTQLLADSARSYTLLKDFGEVKIYEKRFQ